MVGLEDERTVFARYQAIRRAEREYLPDRPDVPPRPAAWTASFKSGVPTP
jgi:hypothetical protein